MLITEKTFTEKWMFFLGNLLSASSVLIHTICITNELTVD